MARNEPKSTTPGGLPLNSTTALRPTLFVACSTIAALLFGGCLLGGCEAAPGTADTGPPAELEYIGSSTIGNFIRDADEVYREAKFTLDTAPESLGGELAVVAGHADLAGAARAPDQKTLDAGVRATLIGKDAIAVIVHPDNPVRNLSIAQLRDVFTGRIKNWQELGGSDTEIHPFIVGPDSATRNVFRSAVLGEADHDGCEVVAPDGAIPGRVAADPAGIGQISFSFLNGDKPEAVRALSVDGKEPTVTNFDYPITRPLHLLWRPDSDRPGSEAVRRFVEWSVSEAGQRVVMRRFVRARVVAEVRPQKAAPVPTGTLVVYTRTFPVFDGQMYYYPHSPYAILSRDRQLVQRVRNHRGENDERPMRIALPPGTYVIRPDAQGSEGAEFLVTIESGLVTEVKVEELIESRRP